jgi:4-amino-4-deoxy-L-arabinose transferase-like glycosyltransferase
MTSERSSQSKLLLGAAIFHLVLMGILAGGSVRHESVTFDELSHIASGTSYVQKLDLRLNMEHPPLSKILAGISLALRGEKADYTHVSWTFSNQGFFKQYIGQWVFGHYFIATWNDPISTVWSARVPMLLVTLLLGWVIYVYGKRLATPTGGLLCLCAFATMPAFITFGPLVLSDTVVTLFSLLTMWTFANLWQNPSRANLLKFGFALGAAILSKFSAGLLFFCFVAFIVSLRMRPVPGTPSEKTELRAWRRKRWGALIKGAVLAALVVYFTYLIFSWGQPTDSFSVIPHFPASPFLRRILMPIWIFLQGFVTFLVTASRPTFILGHSYPHGEWFYFPILFLLKSPLAFLGLLLLAFAVRMVTKSRLKNEFSPAREGMEFHWRAVWMFLLIFFLACVLSRLTISIRHFLTPLALIILLLAPLPRMLEALRNSGWKAARPGEWLTAALAIVLIVLSVRIYPHYMPFLNTLSMGRPNYELVNDSNLDWNQALPEVAKWASARGLQHVPLDAYGFFNPTVYMKQAELWNCQNPAASDGGRWVVVSAGYILDAHNCGWLLHYPREALAGGSMYAFQLPAIIPPAGSPGGPPKPADWRNIGGMPGGMDATAFFASLVRDPQQLQPTWDKFQEYFAEEQRKRKAQAAQK